VQPQAHVLAVIAKGSRWRPDRILRSAMELEEGVTVAHAVAEVCALGEH
jgi:hypothetical protein